MLKHLLPRSLFGRSLVIIIAPMVLLQAVIAYVFFEREWVKVTSRMAGAVAGDIALIVAAGEDMPELLQNQHLFALAERHTQLDMQLIPNAQMPPITAPDFFFPLAEKILLQALRDNLTFPVQVSDADAGRIVVVHVQLSDSLLQINVPKRRLTSDVNHILILWMVSAGLILLSIAIIFLRNQIRPILRLAAAADSFGKGAEAVGFQPSGAAEVRVAAHAFLRMRDRIQRQIRQRTEMLAGVSHDLRTPLTRMKLQLALIDKGSPVKETPCNITTADIENLNADIAEMETMLSGYLAFAKGEESEDSQMTDIRDLIAEIQDGLHRQGKSIDVIIQGQISLSLQQNAIKRCLNNLVNNALTYGKHVRISAWRTPGSTSRVGGEWGESGDIIEIAIDDDGPGIPEAARAEMFLPFRRIENSRNVETGGVGLGLAVAREVIRRHGGDISLEDSSMGGLRALIRLPV